MRTQGDSKPTRLARLFKGAVRPLYSVCVRVYGAPKNLFKSFWKFLEEINKHARARSKSM